MNMHNFTVGAAMNKQQNPLTLEALRDAAPSAFAINKHDSRSSRYTYIPTVDIVQAMMREGYQPFSATQSRARVEDKQDFTKHMIRFRSLSGNQSIRVGDVFPEVVLINSHDGSSSYQISIGFHRYVCSNGLLVSEGMQSAVRIPHKGNIIDLVLEASDLVLKNSDSAQNAIAEWTGIQLKPKEQLAFAEIAHNLRFADADGNVTTPITPQQLLAPRRHADAGNTVWQTMNRVQENVIQGDLTARAPKRDGEWRGRLVRTRKVNGIDQDVRLNRALWALTERMAEIKKEGVQAA
jgi:hypothetical protein